MEIDTYRLQIMACPFCKYETTHRIAIYSPELKCPKCMGATLGEFHHMRDYNDYRDASHSVALRDYQYV